MNEHKLTIMPSGQTRAFPAGTPLLEALLDMGANLKTPCGGKGTCGKCRVKADGQATDVTVYARELSRAMPGYRLACGASLAGDLTVYLEENAAPFLESYPPIASDTPLALAVDIGTTSVRIALIDRLSSQAYLIASFLNPQRRYGHDVISRIAAAANPAAATRLRDLIRERIFGTVLAVLDAMALAPERIEAVVFSGNTTMLYLLYGLDVAPLGYYPYHAPQLDFPVCPPEALACPFPNARIWSLPSASAFVGSDLVSGLAVCHDLGLDRNTFFIDLGTNGELFLINASGTVYATSCAMGPALEGMNITWGMTADAGAIAHIGLEQERLTCTMIGDGDPVGITGTALIDILAILLECGVIRDTGALTEHPLPAPARYLGDSGMRQIGLWGDIALTQQDIRNVQLAKGASLAAARMLLQAAGCEAHTIEHVIVAGALGEHLDLENFRRLGFIPAFPQASYRYLGNTSLKGAEAACQRDDFRVLATGLRDRIELVALSEAPEFYTEFMSAMSFTPGG